MILGTSEDRQGEGLIVHIILDFYEIMILGILWFLFYDFWKLWFYNICGFWIGFKIKKFALIFEMLQPYLVD